MAVGGGPGEFLLTTVDSVARWAQASSVWPLTMGLACCAIEMMTAMSFAAVQKHVAVLERAGLVTKERRGREQLVRTERRR